MNTLSPRRFLYRVLDRISPQHPRLHPTSDIQDSGIVSAIVFSKDRPLQLDALLTSCRRSFATAIPINVIYFASSDRGQVAYEEVASIHGDALTAFHAESPTSPFPDLLRSVLSQVRTRAVTFLVDDDVFIRPVDIAGLAKLAQTDVVPSLRLGRNITYSYIQDRSQPQPYLRRCTDLGSLTSAAQAESLLAWRWRSGAIDWGYPFSLDGNIFVVEMIQEYMDRINFGSPNSLEAELHRLVDLTRSWWGLCFEYSRLVNLPLNRVQTEIPNIHGAVHQDDLLTAWHQGLRMDIVAIEGLRNSSVHQEVAVGLVPRP